MGNPNPVGYNSANAANYYTVDDRHHNECLWNIAKAEVQRERAAAGQAPLKGKELDRATAKELKIIEDANPQILDRSHGGSGSFDLIYDGDKIAIPNRPQTPGVAPQAGATPAETNYPGGANAGQQPDSTVLPAGTVLHPGDSYTSPNGQYTLTMQDDGNLVVYRNSDKKPIYQSGTYTGNKFGLPTGDHAEVDPNGNLVIYTKDDKVAWKSNTSADGDGNSVLALQNDGNLVLYSGHGAIWDARSHNAGGHLGEDRVNGDPKSGTHYAGNVPTGGHLHEGDVYTTPDGHTVYVGDLAPGTRLNKGDSCVSANGKYTLTMQDDGNLVLYRNEPGGKQVAVYQTGTYKNNDHDLGTGEYAVMQADGNLVVYGKDDKNPKTDDSVWSSNSYGQGGQDAHLEVGDCGTLVVMGKDGKQRWDAFNHNHKGLLGADKKVGDGDSGTHYRGDS